jgi:inorganic pyrophosphatase/K(+)-stimulated pyrophosphate-energized sodium pump
MRFFNLSMLAVFLMAMFGQPAMAQEAGGAGLGLEFDPGEMRFYLVWGLCFVASIVALIQAFLFYKKMKASDEGNETMVEIAGYVREGANAYLTQQYKVVALFFVVIFALLAYAAFGLKVQSKWVPFAFITGGFFSGLAGWFGMKTATWASSRTAAGCQKSLNQGLQVAFRSGAVMGLTVVGLGLLDISIWFLVLRWIVPDISLIEITVTMLCFGMGASAQALFARVGGGIFTKAADVGADLVGKVEKGIPEDDARNPATIADNVGDNVGDVAGMGADLYESYCGSILATAALGVAAFSSGTLIEQVVGSRATGPTIEYFQLSALFLPMAIAAVGIFLSILGIYLVRTEDKASQSVLLKALARGINASTFLVAIAAFGLTYWLLPQFSLLERLLGNSGVKGGMVGCSVVIGLVAGWIIGKWTEYSTSDEYKPTQQLAEQAVTGPATLIIAGVADGMKSVWVPVIVVAIATLSSFGFAIGDMSKMNNVEYFAFGLYGVGIAAVGMLSTLGITLATDAYGPIADNAGGNAQMAELEEIVRERTDALDSLGNTTAATGKGFAIGSAALTALALLAAYVEEVRVGFKHWEESVVESGVEPGFYKASPQFIVQVLPDEKGIVENHKGWLVLEGAQQPSFAKDIELGSAIQLADGALVEDDDGRTAKIAIDEETSLSVVQRTKATLPDFTRYYDATLMNPKVLIGIFLGAMATFVFCAMTMKAVGRAAKGMVEEVRRQFRENPGIMERTAKPDYAQPVAISTKAAQKEMVLPSLLGLILPIATGLLLGVGGVMGLLVGTLTCGFCVAIFMANAGGAWDNAKKYIEAGAHGGKNSEAHKAGVVGDTVGDPFKDTSGPSLNILIKLMSMVSVVAAGLIVRYSLLALGIF